MHRPVARAQEEPSRFRSEVELVCLVPHERPAGIHTLEPHGLEQVPAIGRERHPERPCKPSQLPRPGSCRIDDGACLETHTTSNLDLKRAVAAAPESHHRRVAFELAAPGDERLHVTPQERMDVGHAGPLAVEPRLGASFLEHTNEAPGFYGRNLVQLSGQAALALQHLGLQGGQVAARADPERPGPGQEPAGTELCWGLLKKAHPFPRQLCQDAIRNERIRQCSIAAGCVKARAMLPLQEHNLPHTQAAEMKSARCAGKARSDDYCIRC